MDIYCLGSKIYKNDDLAFKVGKILNSYAKDHGLDLNCKECYSVDDILEITTGQDNQRDLILLDAEKGINTVELIEDLSYLADNKLYSNHDLDMSFFIKLLQSIKMVGNVRIILVPIDLSLKEASESVKKIVLDLMDKKHIS